MNICCLLHASFEGLGKIADWIYHRGHACKVVRLYQGDIPPLLEDVDWVVVMGGPMNVYDYAHFPWLREEQHYLMQAISQRKTVLGVCLGAQLLAAVLGAKVYRNREKEVGWHAVTFRPSAEARRLFPNAVGLIDVFQWHGDTFDLPTGAVWLAESEACRHQAFVCQKRLVGLQFHLEITQRGIEKLIANCPEDLTSAPWVQPPDLLVDSDCNQPLTNRILWELLDAMEAATLQKGSS